MKTTILIALLLVLSTCGPNFEAFIVRFNKHYATAEEKAHREGIYLENWAKIEAHNAQNKDYQEGENQFTDLTED